MATVIQLTKMTKQELEVYLSNLAGVQLEITFARKRLVTLSWEGNNQPAFDRLQDFFKGQLYDYEYDDECDFSVCCLNLVLT